MESTYPTSLKAHTEYSCVQCGKHDPFILNGPSGLGSLCSDKCRENFEDLITEASGSIFITGKSSSDESSTILSIRVCLSRDPYDESYFSSSIRKDFIEQCDPAVRPFISGGIQYSCFDHFFQAGKALEGVNPTYTQDFWHSQKKWQPEYPLAPDWDCKVQHWHLCCGQCRSRVYYCLCPRLSIMEARAGVLVPEYQGILRQASVLDRIRDKLMRGYDVIIHDAVYIATSPTGYDEVTAEQFNRALDDSTQDLNYGLLVAGELRRW